MGTKKLNKSRRALMNSTLGALGALSVIAPSSWTKPLVTAIVLPAHAQTSPEFSFSIEKVQSGGPSPAMLDGDIIEYTITVENTGTGPLTGVVATDTMPDGTVIVLSGETESLAIDGVLEVGETWTYETSYTVTGDDIRAGEDLTNTVSVVTTEVPTPQTDDVDTPVVAVVCPDIVIGGAIAGPGSGPVACTLSFDVLSADTTPLTITSITNTALSDGADVVYEAFPVDVTDSVGTRVSWTGELITPECTDFSTSTVVFTVTATCDGAVDPVTMDFTLADIRAMA